MALQLIDETVAAVPSDVRRGCASPLRLIEPGAKPHGFNRFSARHSLAAHQAAQPANRRKPIR